MADNRYTAKIRAKRIELEYFKHLHPFRRWKLILSIVVPLIAGVWLIAYAARGDQRIYTSGTLSTAHAMFETSCSDCHRSLPASADLTKPSNPAFFIPVSDQTCVSCHDGPEHHATQKLPSGKQGPSCASCHVEHKGHTQLASIADNTCTQCHERLDASIKDGKAPTFAKTVTHFDQERHPEFAITVKGDKATTRVRLDQKDAKDTAAVKLNHQKHLKVGLKGIDTVQQRLGKDAKGILTKGGNTQLACAFCHVPDESRKNMQPVSFAKHCADCHPLDVAGVEGTAPHDKPQIVHAFMRTLFIETHEQCKPTPPTDAKLKEQCTNLGLAAAEPEAGAPRGRRGGGGTEEAPAPPSDAPRGGRRGAELMPEVPLGVVLAQARGGRRGEAADAPAAEEAPSGGRGRGRFGRGGEEAEAPAAGGGGAGGGAGAALTWAAQQMTGAEKLMFKTCETCHVMKSEPNKLPVVAPTLIPARWLPHSTFDHGAHRPLGCVECHGTVAASTETTDVLLPKAQVCRECHQPRGGARTGCVECHLYHDKTKERDPNGPLTVNQVVKRQPAAAGPASKR